jgi:hypothetical protein
MISDPVSIVSLELWNRHTRRATKEPNTVCWMKLSPGIFHHLRGINYMAVWINIPPIPSRLYRKYCRNAYYRGYKLKPLIKCAPFPIHSVFFFFSFLFFSCLFLSFLRVYSSCNHTFLGLIILSTISSSGMSSMEPHEHRVSFLFLHKILSFLQPEKEKRKTNLKFRLNEPYNATM